MHSMKIILSWVLLAFIYKISTSISNLLNCFKKFNNQRLKSTLFYSAHVELMKFSLSDLSQRWSVYEEAWYLISGSCLAVAALLMINVTFWSWWRLTINQVLSCINTTMTDWSNHGKLKKKNLFRNRKQIIEKLDKTFVYSKWKPIQLKNFGPLCMWVKVCNKINCSVVNSCQSWYSHDTSAIIICQNIFMFIHHQRFHINAVLKLF